MDMFLCTLWSFFFVKNWFRQVRFVLLAKSRISRLLYTFWVPSSASCNCSWFPFDVSWFYVDLRASDMFACVFQVSCQGVCELPCLRRFVDLRKAPPWNFGACTWCVFCDLWWFSVSQQSACVLRCVRGFADLRKTTLLNFGACMLCVWLSRRYVVVIFVSAVLPSSCRPLLAAISSPFLRYLLLLVVILLLCVAMCRYHNLMLLFCDI